MLILYIILLEGEIMLSDVLKDLRIKNKLTQEVLADSLNVTRQTYAKWEKGEAIPDIYTLKRLCEMYQVSIDEILDSNKNDAKSIKPKDKFFFGIIEIKEGGVITLPSEALKVFNFKTGDQLAVFGDLNQGIALADAQMVTQFAKEVLSKDNKNE